MKLRTWHLAAALCVSLALHAGAAGVYLSGDEPALMAGGSPAVSAEIGEVFADVIQAGTSQEGEEATKTEVQPVTEPVEAPEADEAVAESTALEESVSPEATDPTEVPVLETATEGFHRRAERNAGRDARGHPGRAGCRGQAGGNGVRHGAGTGFQHGNRGGLCGCVAGRNGTGGAGERSRHT